ASWYLCAAPAPDGGAGFLPPGLRPDAAVPLRLPAVPVRLPAAPVFLPAAARAFADAVFVFFAMVMSIRLLSGSSGEQHMEKGVKPLLVGVLPQRALQ